AGPRPQLPRAVSAGRPRTRAPPGRRRACEPRARARPRGHRGDLPRLPRQGAVIPRLSCRRSGPAAAGRQVSESSLFPPAKAIVTLGSVALALSLSGLAGVFRLARRDELLRGWRSPLLWPRRWRQPRGGGRARVELEG